MRTMILVGMCIALIGSVIMTFMLLKEKETEWKLYARAVNAVLESCANPGQA